MKTTAITSNGLPKDRFHFAQNTAEYNQYTETGISAGYGFEYVTQPKEHLPGKAIIVTQIDSPADNVGIQRGAEIISIDGENLIDGDPAKINAGLIPSKMGENHTFVIRRSQFRYLRARLFFKVVKLLQ